MLFCFLEDFWARIPAEQYFPPTYFFLAIVSNMSAANFVASKRRLLVTQNAGETCGILPSNLRVLMSASIWVERKMTEGEMVTWAEKGGGREKKGIIRIFDTRRDKPHVKVGSVRRKTQSR